MTASPPASDRPWEETFAVSAVTVVVETEALRALEIALRPGECVPWHAHSRTPDIFYPIEGVIDVHEKMPETVHRLVPGQTHTVPARRAHLVHNPTGGLSRFLVLQGPGEYDYLPIGDQARPDFEAGTRP